MRKVTTQSQTESSAVLADSPKANTVGFEGFEGSTIALPAPDQSTSPINIAGVEGDPPNLQNPRNPRTERTEINLTGGYDPHELVPYLWQLIAAGNKAPILFVAETGPVRLEIRDGKPVVSELTGDALIHEVHRVAKFVTVSGRGDVRDKACPRQVVNEMAAIPLHKIPLPRLRQISTAPLLADKAGTILFRNGFDAASGILSGVPKRGYVSRIAQRYGVTPHAISKIIHGRAWRREAKKTTDDKISSAVMAE